MLARLIQRLFPEEPLWDCCVDMLADLPQNY